MSQTLEASTNSNFERYSGLVRKLGSLGFKDFNDTLEEVYSIWQTLPESDRKRTEEKIQGSAVPKYGDCSLKEMLTIALDDVLRSYQVAGNMYFSNHWPPQTPRFLAAVGINKDAWKEYDDRVVKNELVLAEKERFVKLFPVELSYI